MEVSRRFVREGSFFGNVVGIGDIVRVILGRWGFRKGGYSEFCLDLGFEGKFCIVFSFFGLVV